MVISARMVDVDDLIFGRDERVIPASGKRRHSEEPHLRVWIFCFSSEFLMIFLWKSAGNRGSLKEMIKGDEAMDG